MLELLEQFLRHGLNRTLPRNHAETQKAGLLILRSAEHRNDKRCTAECEDLLLGIVHHQAVQLARFSIGRIMAAQFRISRLEHRSRVLHMDYGITLEGRLGLGPEVHLADFLTLKVALQTEQAQHLGCDTPDGSPGDQRIINQIGRVLPITQR